MNELAKIGRAGTELRDPVPHNVEAEQQLLGAILTNNDVFDRIAALVSATDFHDPVHGRIFEVAKSRPQIHAVMSIAAARTTARSAKTALSSLVAPLIQKLRRRFFITDRHGFRLATQCLDLKEVVKRRHLKAGLGMRGPKLRLPAWAGSPRNEMVMQGGHRSRAD